MLRGGPGFFEFDTAFDPAWRASLMAADPTEPELCPFCCFCDDLDRRCCVDGDWASGTDTVDLATPSTAAAAAAAPAGIDDSLTFVCPESTPNIASSSKGL